MLPFLMVVVDEAVRGQMEQVYLTYHDLLYKVSYDILKDHHEAQDMVQEAIINFSRYSNKIEEVNCKKTRGLIVTIVRNLSYNVFNKRNKVIRIEPKEVAAIEDENTLLIEKQLIKYENNQEITRMLRKLKQSYADIISLRYYYDFTTEEIAQVLKVNESNVYARLSRARSAFKELLEKEGVGSEWKI